MIDNDKITVLFICMGNICRSPSAQGVFECLIAKKGLSKQFRIDSAGTHSYHIGSKPDARSIFFAKQRAIDISKQQARKVNKADFEEFDFIIAMDDDNYLNLLAICPAQYQGKVYEMMQFAPHTNYTSVPDPYYGGEKGFDLVLDLLENACVGLLREIKKLK